MLASKDPGYDGLASASGCAAAIWLSIHSGFRQQD